MPTKPRGTKNDASGFPAKRALKHPPVCADVRLGVVAVFDGNGDLLVIEAEKEPRKLPIAHRSTIFDHDIGPTLNSVKIVEHEGPCILVSWRDDQHDGPGLGLFALDGAPIQILYALTAKERQARRKGKTVDRYAHVEILAVSPTGTTVAYEVGDAMHIVRVADLAKGGPGVRFEDDDARRWAVFAGHDDGVYTHGEDSPYVVRTLDGVEKPVFDQDVYAERLYAYESGALCAMRIVTEGKSKPVEANTWYNEAIGKAVQDGPEDCTITTAAGRGDLIAVGPGSHKAQFLMFVQPSTGKLVRFEKWSKHTFSLFLMDSTLFILDDKAIHTRAW